MTEDNDNNDGSSNEFEALMKLFEASSFLYKERVQPLVEGMKEDDGGGEQIGGRRPLAESHVKPSRVLIVAEVTDPGEEAKVWDSGGSIIIETGEHSFEADVPGDVDLSSIDATINNGVMRVEIPREHDVSLDVSQEQESNDDGEGSDESPSDGDDSDFHLPDDLEDVIDDLDSLDEDPEDYRLSGGEE